MRKGTKMYSILKGTCPKCHEESMYINKNPYDLKETLLIHEHCGHCNLKYMMEPSFFYGAMYINYAIGVAQAVFIFVVSFFFIGLSIPFSIVILFVGLTILTPFSLRLGRNIWINLFIHFDKNWKESSKLHSQTLK